MGIKTKTNMEIKTAIELKRWGDYDIQQTKCVMVSVHKYEVNNFLHKFYGLMGIKTNDRTGDDINEYFIDFLEDRGFKKLKTKEVCFSD